MQSAAEAAIAVFGQFGKQANDLKGVFGSLDAVSAAFAVEFPDLIALIRRAGGSFKSAGGSLEELLALFTAVRSTTRASAESIATGFNTIIARLQRASLINMLRDMNIQLRDANGLFVGPYEAVRRLNKALAETDTRSEVYAKIVEELGGFRQLRNVIPLIQQFQTRAEPALQVALEGRKSGLGGYEEVLQTLSVQLQKVREEFLALMRDIVGTQSFKAITSTILELAKAFISLANAITPAIPLLTALGAMKLARAVLPFGKNLYSGVMTSHKAQGGRVGYARGGSVPVKLMPGEGVITNPATVNKVGLAALDRLNRVDKTGIAVVPGIGDTDSYNTTLPAGSYVIRKRAMGKVFGAKKMATGGPLKGGGIGSAKLSDISVILAARKKQLGEEKYAAQQLLQQEEQQRKLSVSIAKTRVASIQQFAHLTSTTAVAMPQNIYSQSISSTDIGIKPPNILTGGSGFRSRRMRYVNSMSLGRALGRPSVNLEDISSQQIPVQGTQGRQANVAAARIRQYQQRYASGAVAPSGVSNSQFQYTTRNVGQQFLGVGLQTRQQLGGPALTQFAQSRGMSEKQLSSMMAKRTQMIGLSMETTKGLARQETLVQRSMRMYDRVILQGGNAADAYVAAQRVLTQQIRNQSKRGLMGNLGAGIGGVGRWAGGKLSGIGRNIGNYSLGAMFALQMSGVLNPNEKSTNIKGEARKQAAGSALGGAFIGGMVAGPWGAVIAGTITGMASFENAMLDLEKKIADEQVSSSLSNLSDAVDRYSKGILSKAGMQAAERRFAEAGSRQDEALKRQQEGGFANLGGFLKSGIVGMFSKKTYDELEAERNAPKAEALFYQQEDRLVSQAALLEPELQKAAMGMGRKDFEEKYLGKIITVAKSRLSYEESQKGGAVTKQAKSEVDTIFAVKGVQQAIDKVNKQFTAVETMASSLAKAFSTARDSVKGFQSSLDITAGVFSGQIGFKASTYQEDVFKNRALMPTQFGATVGGVGSRYNIPKSLQTMAIEGNVIQAKLSGVLENIGNMIEGEGTGAVTIEDAIAREFGGSISGGAVSLLVGQISELLVSREQGAGLAELRGMSVKDREGLSQRITSRWEGISQLFEEFVKQEREVYQEYIDNLSQAANLQKQIIEVQSKLYNLDLNMVRVRAQRKFEDFQSGTSTDIGGVARAFRAQQFRITGMAGSTDARTLIQQLRNLPAQLQQANADYLNLSANPNASREDITNAGKKIVELQLATDRARQGLINLADSTEVLSEVQRRLSELQKSEENRFDLFTRYYSGSASDRRNLTREIQAGQMVAQRGGFEGLSIRQQQLAIRGLQSTGELSGVTGRTGNQVLRGIFKGGPFAGLGGGVDDEIEKTGLRKMEDVLMANQRDAVSGLSGVLTDSFSLFLAGLEIKQEKLFANLNTFAQNIANRGFASGGTVRGPGGIDKVPAMLTRGEYVVNADKANKYRVMLDAINRGGVSMMAGGGITDYEEWKRNRPPLPILVSPAYPGRDIGVGGGVLTPSQRMKFIGRQSKEQIEKNLGRTSADERLKRLGREPDENIRRQNLFMQRSGFVPQQQPINDLRRALPPRGLPDAINPALTRDTSALGGSLTNFSTSLERLTKDWKEIVSTMPTTVSHEINIGEHNVTVAGGNGIVQAIADEVVRRMKADGGNAALRGGDLPPNNRNVPKP